MARKIEVEIVGDSKSLERAFGRASSSAKKFNVSITSLVKSAAVIGLIGSAVAGVGSLIGTAADEWKDMATVAAQTNAVIKATGGAAKVTAREVDALANSIAAYSGEDDEAVKSASNLLLTFKQIKNEVGAGNQIFNRATAAAVDLARAGFGSMTSTAKQLGKALNDPVKGMTALGRAGVTFTEAQKKQIKGLVESGRLLEAQKVLLREVESQVGGSAKAFGRTLPGQLARLKESFRNELGGLAQLVARPLGEALGHVNSFIDRFQKARSAKAKFKIAFEGLENLGARVFALARDSIARINWNEAVRTAQQGLIAGLRRIAGALNEINWSEVGRRLGQAIATGFKGTAAFLRSVDWQDVGQTIVRGISDFLKSVDWRAVAVGSVKLLVAAFIASRQLLLGVGKELGGQLMAGIGAGLARAQDFVLQKLLAFVNKILGVTGFLGRFDPFRGVRAKVQKQLAAMEADTRSTVSKMNGHLTSLQDVDLTITIDTITTFDGKRRPEEGTSPLSVAQGAARNRVSDSKAREAAKSAKAAALARRKASDAASLAADKAAQAAKTAAQKAAAAAKKAAVLRDKAFGEALDSLALKFDRSEAAGSFRQALAVLADQEKAVRAQIAAAGRSVALERQLFQIEQERASIKEQQRDARREAAEKAAARSQQKQFRLLGLNADGGEVIPGAENLRKQLASITARLAEAPGQVPSKLTNRLAGVRKLLSKSFDGLTDESREGIRELFAAIRGEFDAGANSLDRIQRITLGEDTLKALGFTSRDAFNRGLPGRSSSSVQPPAAAVAAGSGELNITGPITVVANDPDDFLSALQKKAGRTTATSRGRYAGRSLGLS